MKFKNQNSTGISLEGKFDFNLNGDWMFEKVMITRLDNK